MATRTTALSVGAGIGVGVPRSRTVTLGLGAGLGIGAVPWGGSNARRSQVPWIPKAGTPWLAVDANGRMTNQVNPAWDRSLRWLFEQFAGGINGQTIPDLLRQILQTQAEVVNVANYTEQVANYAAGIAATTDATVQVTQDAGLSGSASIPPTPEPPERPSGGSRQTV